MIDILRKYAAIIVVIIIVLLVLFRPTKAESSIISDNCEKIAQVNTIEVYRCEPDQGVPFKMNTLGFMLED